MSYITVKLLFDVKVQTEKSLTKIIEVFYRPGIEIVKP